MLTLSKTAPAARLHADRAAGGHRHHRHPDRPAAAGRAEGPRGRQPHQVRQQPQAARPGRPPLSRRASASAARHRLLSARRQRRVRHLLFPLAAVPRARQPLRSALGSVPFPPPDGPTTVYYPGNNNVYSQPVPIFLCPSDPSVGPGGVVTIDGVSFGASCYAPNALVIGAERPHHDPSTAIRRARPASPPTSRTARRTPFSMPRNMPAAPTRPWRRRSGTAARRGRTARPPRSPGCRRP